MRSNARQNEPARGSVALDADVLVIGGGPAGTWAAWSAASQGARVVLVDKGYCGTSGATAPSGVGVWYVPPDARLREEARASREALGGFLSERSWMDRVLDCTYDNVRRLGDWGYPFPCDDAGQPARRSLQGPEYMRLMRKRVKAAGVRILDHSPALELLVDDHGVAGAAGVSRQDGLDYRVQAHAVVIATGGCAFLSRALCCNVLTGDGGLLAAEAGADLSGMEFSNAYGIAPAFASVTKSAFYRWATFYYEDGREIPGAGSARGRSIIARQQDCQTCFMCELYCPVDALFVAPQADGHVALEEAQLSQQGLLGSYRAVVGWGEGRVPGASKDRSFQLLAPSPAPAKSAASGGRPSRWRDRDRCHPERRCPPGPVSAPARR
jgi:NAD-dependent dihydropyrimidine dehydrogenase PreA subunit